MLPYVALVCVVYVLYFCNFIRRSDLFARMALLCIFAFSSVRFMVGWDYASYYDSIVYNIDSNVIARGEFLTVALIEIARSQDSPFFYFFVNAVILFLPLWWFLIRESTDKWLSIVIFLCFPLFFLNSLSVVRMFSAIGIVLIAVNFLVDKRFVRFFVFVLVAASLHKSALLALLFVIFVFFRPSRILWVIFLLFSGFSGYIFADLLRSVTDVYDPIYSVYLKITEVQEGTRAIYVFVAFIFALFFVDYEAIKASKKLSLYYNIYLFGVCIYLAFIDFGTAGHRLSLYATIYLVPLLPNFVRAVDRRSLKLGINVSLHFFFLVVFFYAIVVGAETYIPYMTIFEDGL